jgi:hypothetical protein
VIWLQVGHGMHVHCRGCFERLTEYRNKQKDTERYIPQLEAKVKTVKKWHKILNYSNILNQTKHLKN